MPTQTYTFNTQLNPSSWNIVRDPETVSGAFTLELTPVVMGYNYIVNVINVNVELISNTNSFTFSEWKLHYIAKSYNEVVIGPLRFGIVSNNCSNNLCLIIDTSSNGDSFTAFDVTACFCAGALIATPEGARAIETLRIGDRALTADGGVETLRWIGRRVVHTRFADPLRSWPVRIMAGALDENLPTQDLLLSPDHALYLDGALVHAGALVNGRTIVQQRPQGEPFTYYHLEIDSHALILANGTPAETFVDTVERMAFDNWAEHEALYPRGRSVSELPYPRAKSARQLPRALRQRLDARATAPAPQAA